MLPLDIAEVKTVVDPEGHLVLALFFGPKGKRRLDKKIPPEIRQLPLEKQAKIGICLELPKLFECF